MLTSLRQLIVEQAATAIVASAACGADLLALRLADELGIRSRVVLPFAPGRFRESSVTDRPGDWGPLFDEVVARVGAAGDLVVLDHPEGGGAAYAAANAAILDEAVRLAGETAATPLAVIAWDGRSRGSDDLTEAFYHHARERGLKVEVVATVEEEVDEVI